MSVRRRADHFIGFLPTACLYDRGQVAILQVTCNIATCPLSYKQAVGRNPMKWSALLLTLIVVALVGGLGVVALNALNKSTSGLQITASAYPLGYLASAVVG